MLHLKKNCRRGPAHWSVLLPPPPPLYICHIIWLNACTHKLGNRSFFYALKAMQCNGSISSILCNSDR
jgi:hypothetical protein